MKKIAFALFLLFICFAFALAEPAEDITKQAKFTVSGLVSGTLRRLTDRDRQTALQTDKQKQPTLTIAMQEGACAALYIEYGNNIMPFSVQVKQEGQWVEIARWEESYAQAYVEFDPQTDFRLAFDTGGTKKALYIRELYLFSEGERNDVPQIWQPACEKADLLVLAAHPDDELLWFGGLIPYYAGERGMAVQVCYLTCANSCRRVELLNGLWHCGVRNYPDIGNYKDIKLYNGCCYVHENYDPDLIQFFRSQNPNLKVISHPECNPSVAMLSDYVGSTGQMVSYINQQPKDSCILLLTECGLNARMHYEHPDMNFIGSCCMCKYMKSNSLENILEALRHPEKAEHISLDEGVRVKAKKCIDAMFKYAE